MTSTPTLHAPPAPPATGRATPGGAALPRGASRWMLLALACVLALGLVLDAGCTVRSRGQYDVSAGKTTRP